MSGSVLLGGGLRTPALGYGMIPLSGGYGPLRELDALDLIHYVIDRGGGFFDAADTYGDGAVEELLGRALARRRSDRVCVATKIGLVDGGRGGVSNDPSYLRSALEMSLRRLRVDRIDLLYLHRVAPHVPIEDTVGAMADFVRDGMVEHLGLSEVTAVELEVAVSVHPIAAVQSEWSIWSRDIERYVIPAAAKAGVGIVASSPLGRGFLAGRTEPPLPGDQRRRLPRFEPEHRPANLAVARELEDLAREANMTPAQLAIGWLIAAARRAGVTMVPIPGTRSRSHFDENLAAADRAVSPGTITKIDALAGLVTGDRGNAKWLSFGRE